jgi:gamma-glutamylcyclotransferase (GGCT)/AIG2-like uncharacterized protein YtfP
MADPAIFTAQPAIFTYGSLMFEPVWSRVVAGRYTSARAQVSGFARRKIRDVTYPAAIPRADSMIEGRVYQFSLGPDAQADAAQQAADIAALDHFEDVDYERVQVEVELLEPLGSRPAGGKIASWIYVFREPSRVLDEPWDVQWFAQTGIHEFIASYVKRRTM